MTPKELTQHWKMPMEEVKQISNVINYLYFVDLLFSRKNHSSFWRVALFANDGKKDYILIENSKKFLNKNQAIIQGTDWAQNIKLTEGQAKLMGIPKDAFLILKPIDGYDRLTRPRHYFPKKIVYSSRQHMY